MKRNNKNIMHLFLQGMIFIPLLFSLAACAGVSEKDDILETQRQQPATEIGQWIWMSGDSKTDQRGVYGTKGVADAANKPGARYGSVGWIDNSGNLWLFGGDDGTGLRGSFNDLWKFDGANWTWASGDNKRNQRGIYGTRGVAAPANKPGARANSISWIDNLGNLWLFGGDGYAASGDPGYLNDLWKFDGVNWTWVSGDNKTDQRGVYGSRGIADAANKPGTRSGSTSWIDSSDNLWLFGGEGYDQHGAEGYLNDLWKFDGAEWTWVSGDSTRSEIGVYSDKGVAESDNKPGARRDSISWTDGSGNLWLFGGHGYANISWKGGSRNLWLRDPGAGYLNDFWKFDGADWTWVSGDNAASYNPHVPEDNAKEPHSRYGGIGWTDGEGNLWLFGGDAQLRYGRVANDLWKFDGTNWTLVSGDSEEYERGVYGVKGVAAVSNMPGARSGSTGWVDGKGDLWLFGGRKPLSARGYDYFNDLWKFEPQGGLISLD